MKNSWNLSCAERLSFFSKNERKPNVVYIYETFDMSTFRYRVYNICQTLQLSNSWRACYFFENEISYLEDYLDQIQILVIVRVRWTYQLDAFIEKAKRHGIAVLFDIDDLIFSIDELPGALNNIGFDCDENISYTHWFSTVSRLYLTGKRCHATIGTNEFICQQLENTFRTPSFMINNFLNHEQIKVSEELYQSKSRDSKKDLFSVGYFSGSRTHIKDFKQAAIELQDLLHDYPDIKIQVIGYMQFPVFLDRFIRKKQVIFSPFVDFITLQKKIAAVDVNIVPLLQNVFTNCKSELKFFEAAIVGTITCATPTHVFKTNIQHERTGFLCQEGDWYDAIERIYKREIDPKITERAREYCLDKYSPEAQLKNIEEVLGKARALSSCAAHG